MFLKLPDYHLPSCGEGGSPRLGFVCGFWFQLVLSNLEQVRDLEKETLQIKWNSILKSLKLNWNFRGKTKQLDEKLEQF